MRSAWTIFLLAISTIAGAQQSAASLEFFDTVSGCAASLGGWKCLELDLSSEAALENDSTKDYVYSWNMGDGMRMQGDKIEHCFDQFRSYQVTMDLIDAETTTVIRNELSATVDLYPEITPSIVIGHENLPPSFVEFSCQYNEADKFDPDDVFWRIDGKYYEGKKVVHPFHTAGVYQIEMGIQKNTELTGLMTACAMTEITIHESDIWSAQIMNFIKTSRKNSSVGPFAQSDVFCLLTPRTSPQDHRIIPINFLMSQLDLKENQEYDIMLFTGNMFTGTIRINTSGLTGNDLYGALKDSVSSFLRKPLSVFNSIEINQGSALASVHEPILKETAELLIQNPLFKIEVGAYVHTGSRLEKGIFASLQRAMLVKEALVKYGVAKDRISVASPANNQALVNTCSAIPDCNWEDKSLNGKVEFKIIGTTL